MQDERYETSHVVAIHRHPLKVEGETVKKLEGVQSTFDLVDEGCAGAVGDIHTGAGH